MTESLNQIEIVYFVFSLLIIFLFFIFFPRIAKNLNIFDEPNEKRKIHSESTPSIGGFLFFPIFLFYGLMVLFFDIESDLFDYNNQIISIIFCASLIFFFGILDDKVNIESAKKSIFFIVVILIFISNDNDSNIYFIRFETLDKVFALNNFTFLFTVFCIFTFMNLFNMYDGINLQSGLYLLFLSLLFIMKNIEVIFFISIVIALIFFLFFNFKNKIFLGNGGAYFLSFLFAIFFIKGNLSLSKISTEEILILMLIPGLDMLRLFVSRLIKNQSPFLADNNHIHHLFLKKFNKTKSAFFIFFLTLFPYLAFKLSDLFFAVVLIQLTAYIFFNLYLKKLNN